LTWQRKYIETSGKTVKDKEPDVFSGDKASLLVKDVQITEAGEVVAFSAVWTIMMQ
jgi:hypothetical protein